MTKNLKKDFIGLSKRGLGGKEQLLMESLEGLARELSIALTECEHSEVVMNQLRKRYEALESVLNRYRSLREEAEDLLQSGSGEIFVHARK